MKRILVIATIALVLTTPLAQAEGTGQNLVVRIGPAASDAEWRRTGKIVCTTSWFKRMVLFDRALSWPPQVTKAEANLYCRQNAAQKY